MLILLIKLIPNQEQFNLNMIQVANLDYKCKSNNFNNNFNNSIKKKASLHFNDEEAKEQNITFETIVVLELWGSDLQHYLTYGLHLFLQKQFPNAVLSVQAQQWNSLPTISRQVFLF